MGQSRVHRYTAAHAIVTWNEGVCRHAAECVRGLPEVFNPKERPWIAPCAATGAKASPAPCRCGMSADKPFCDGSHERIGLKD